MYWVNSLSDLEFDQHGAFNKQVRNVFAYPNAVIPDGYGVLLFDAIPGLS